MVGSFVLRENDENDLLLRSLTKIIDQLEQQGLIKVADKEELIGKVVASINNENQGQLPKLVLNHGQLNKTFTDYLMTMVLKEHLSLDLNVARLFKDIPLLSEKEKAQLQNKLQQEIEKCLEKLNKLSPKPKMKTPDQIKEIAKTLADHFVNDPSLKPLDGRTIGFFSVLMVQLAAVKKQEEPENDYLRVFLAGMRPEGGQQSIITELKANPEGFVSLSEGLATSFSFLDEQKRYDGGPDYMGEEHQELLAIASLGMIVSWIADEMISDKILESPHPTLSIKSPWETG